MGKPVKTTNVISSTRAKQDFDLLIEEARGPNRRFIVEVRGKPMAVILGIEEWENILEALAEVEVKDGDQRYLLPTALGGGAGKVLQAVGVAIPPPVRPAPVVVPKN